MENKVCPACEKPMEPSESVCPACGGATETEAPISEAPRPGMKWHSFLCGWLLIVGGLGLILSVIGYGLSIFSRPRAMEHLSPALFACFLAQGLITMGCSALMLWAGRELRRFRKRGLRLYMLQLGLYAILSNLLDTVERALGGLPAFHYSVPVNLVIVGVFLWLNHLYFRRRAHLYVN